MTPSEAFGDIAARLLATSAITDIVDKEIHIDYPGDPERDAEYTPANSRAFIYFAPSSATPVSGCGGYAMRLRIFAVTFDAARLEAWDLINLIVSALDEAFGASPLSGLTVSFTAAGDVVEPFNPKSAYADFAFTI